jgi:predicted metal-dependent hydrolase
METYDPRYLIGIQCFNQGDFFEAHEHWEDLWSEGHGNSRRFYQGLIQAAVGLCHYCNGNLGGALKLYHSAREYMRPCLPRFLGLDVAEFWQQMERCYQPILGENALGQNIGPRDEDLPVLRLDPPPQAWPDAADFPSED